MVAGRQIETGALVATWGGLGSAASDGSSGGALSGHFAWDGSAGRLQDSIGDCFDRLKAGFVWPTLTILTPRFGVSAIV